MIPYMVKELERLSQEEGLGDEEIAHIFGCSRATINRARQTHGIPTAKLENRRDKQYTCTFCNKTIQIRRKERKKRYCDECRTDLKIGKK